MCAKQILTAVLLLVLAAALCACGGKTAVDQGGSLSPETYAEAKQKLDALIAEDAASIEEDSAERETGLAESFGEIASALAPLGEYAPSDKDEKASSLCSKARYYRAACLQKAAALAEDPRVKQDCLEEAISISSDLGAYGLGPTKKASKIYKACSLEYADMLFAAGDRFEDAALYYTSAGNTDAANLCRYRIAENFYDQGNYEAAYEEYETIRSITISNEETGESIVIRDLLKNDEHLVAAREAKYVVGNIVTFGSYNGEPLSWYILRREGNDLLLLSADIIDCKQYSKTWTAVNWEQSSMRLFLTAEFLSGFTSEQKGMLITEMKNTPIGVSDPVFLLSREEVKTYCGESTVKAKVSEKASAMGVWQDDAGNGWWWLRDCIGDRAMLIRHDGTVEKDGYYVNYGHAGVRPAVRISIAED